ncbi:MAG: alpha/beta hydrolase [Gemmatimonadaceae bacterium]
MKIPLALVALRVALLVVARPAHAQDTARASTLAGDLRVDTLRSAVFGNARAIRVLLPAGYAAPENRGRSYPVLYLNDGQSLFDRATSTFQPAEWRVDETVARLRAEGALPPIVVVGIDHGGRRVREHEYLPWPDAFLEPPDPRPVGARYPAFVVDEVLPFVESRYRVARTRDGRVLGGSSYGALAALYAAAARPGVFRALLLESPSLYVADARVLREVARARAVPSRVYLGVGTNELSQPTCTPADGGGEAVADVRRLARLLRDRGLTRAAVRVVVEPCAVHHEDAWARRLPGALTFLFAR